MSNTQTRSNKSNLDKEDKQTMDKIFDYIDKKFDSLKKDIIQKIECQNTESIKSIEYISAQYDEIIKKLDINNNQNKSIQNELENIKKEQVGKNATIKKMELRLDEIEYTSNLNYLEIAGIPQKNGEQLEEIIKKVASAAGVQIKHADISKVTRTTDRRLNAPPKILVKFTEIKQKEILLSKKREMDLNLLKDLTNEKVYIGEVISPYKKELLWKAKQLAKEKNYEFVWIKNGKIMVRKGHDQKILYVNHLDDLDKLI